MTRITENERVCVCVRCVRSRFNQNIKHSISQWNAAYFKTSAKRCFVPLRRCLWTLHFKKHLIALPSNRGVNLFFFFVNARTKHSYSYNLLICMYFGIQFDSIQIRLNEFREMAFECGSGSMVRTIAIEWQINKFSIQPN